MSDETRGLSPVAREHLKQCRAELAKARKTQPAHEPAARKPETEEHA